MLFEFAQHGQKKTGCSKFQIQKEKSNFDVVVWVCSPLAKKKGGWLNFVLGFWSAKAKTFNYFEFSVWRRISNFLLVTAFDVTFGICSTLAKKTGCSKFKSENKKSISNVTCCVFSTLAKKTGFSKF